MAKTAFNKALSKLKNHVYPNRIIQRRNRSKVVSIAVDPSSTREDVIDFIRLLRPVDVGYPLIRVGSERDGGYLIPNDLAGIVGCFSPGVEVLADFEDTLARVHGINCYLADNSVDRAPIDNKLFDFDKKHLGVTNDARYMRLADWVTRKVGVASVDDLILQMDIEGAEYDVIEDTPRDVLKRFRTMVIEFHDLEDVFQRGALERLTALMRKITQDFAVAHIHPNNFAPVYNAHGLEVPSVLEVTFVRKDRVRASGRTLRLPHPLDRKNLHWKDDIILQGAWVEGIAGAVQPPVRSMPTLRSIVEGWLAKRAAAAAPPVPDNRSPENVDHQDADDDGQRHQSTDCAA